MQLEYQVGLGGMGRLEPLFRVTSSSSEQTDRQTDTQIHRIRNTCSANRLGDLTFTPKGQPSSLLAAAPPAQADR